jgi:hypothetical protein
MYTCRVRHDCREMGRPGTGLETGLGRARLQGRRKQSTRSDALGDARNSYQ